MVFSFLYYHSFSVYLLMSLYLAHVFAPTLRLAIRSGLYQRRLQCSNLFCTIPQQIPPSALETTAMLRDSGKPTYRSLALLSHEDDPEIRKKYRPFVLSDDTAEDWINELELITTMDMAEEDLRKTNDRLKVLVLYGSLRRRSYSRLVAYEASRVLFRLGCDVRVFDPEGLPVKNDTDHGHPKVQELRELSRWSDGHIWVSPEQHGNLVSSTNRLAVDIYTHLLSISAGARRRYSRTKSIGFP